MENTQDNLSSSSGPVYPPSTVPIMPLLTNRGLSLAPNPVTHALSALSISTFSGLTPTLGAVGMQLLHHFLNLSHPFHSLFVGEALRFSRAQPTLRPNRL
ncbi:hypothetical protein H104_08958 [Trichophyton rubrum CBS 289.86]|nr:hypothetical protein H104_08958 [Trichophyton rubrum CBS 289.86]